MGYGGGQFPCTNNGWIITSDIILFTIAIDACFGFIRSHLTHWGRVTHICVNKLTIIGSDNGLSPDRRQAIIWTNAGILLIGPLGTNFSEILIEIHALAFRKMHLKMSSGKWRPFCLGLNVLRVTCHMTLYNTLITVVQPWLRRSCQTAFPIKLLLTGLIILWLKNFIEFCSPRYDC